MTEFKYSDEIMKDYTTWLEKASMYGKVIDNVRRIKNLEALKFLLDFSKEEQEKWIDNALYEFDHNPLLKSLECDSATEKLMAVKAYRKLLQRKRRSKEDLNVDKMELLIAMVNTYNLA